MLYNESKHNILALVGNANKKRRKKKRRRRLGADLLSTQEKNKKRD
jgi:hypothetical protein